MTVTTAWPDDLGTTLPRRAVRVSVHASDPLVRTGLVSELRGKLNIELVDDQSAADVAVVVQEAGIRDVLSAPIRRLVLIADEPRQAELLAALEHGLIVLVPRTEVTGIRLLRAIADARRGHGDLPPEQLGRLLSTLSRLHRQVLAPQELALTGFSTRELAVLRLLADGLNTKLIAARLSFSDRTVKNILQGILTRLGLHNRTHAVAYAIRHGLI